MAKVIAEAAGAPVRAVAGAVKGVGGSIAQDISNAYTDLPSKPWYTAPEKAGAKLPELSRDELRQQLNEIRNPTIPITPYKSTGVPTEIGANREYGLKRPVITSDKVYEPLPEGAGYTGEPPVERNPPGFPFAPQAEKSAAAAVERGTGRYNIPAADETVTTDTTIRLRFAHYCITTSNALQKRQRKKGGVRMHVSATLSQARCKALIACAHNPFQHMN